jgi:N-acetylglutamate synthase-like GNAT family acetyltransferase
MGVADRDDRIPAESRYTGGVLADNNRSDYFPNFGFEKIDRSVVPKSVQASVEFTSACPSTAVVMRKNLAVS